MPITSMTLDEVVSTMARSSLPTVITEGNDDYSVFRRLEGTLHDVGVSVLPVGGKNSVLEAFRRRAAFSHIRTAFIVDSDLWLFQGVPAEFAAPEFITTDGYSIENDLYRDGDLERLLDPHEKTRFEIDRDAICRWFSYAVRCCLESSAQKLSYHPKQLIVGKGRLDEQLMEQCGFSEPCSVLYPLISAEYAKYLRGKTLIELLVSHLSYKGRHTQHNTRALMEFASITTGPYVNAIGQRLNNIFRA